MAFGEPEASDNSDSTQAAKRTSTAAENQSTLPTRLAPELLVLIALTSSIHARHRDFTNTESSKPLYEDKKIRSPHHPDI